ncbi:MAG TPA: HNH endonuclease [Clostridiaceae bacterium]|jgi:5-methylcytosine-specific restriction endonuclease McrA|nr:HNH endonuclease [Clostridiaceae bacterium]
MVFVLDKHKKPLMPCTEKRARLLLTRGRAVVHKMQPFTIRLKDRTVEESQLQPLRLKLDPGSKTTGVAVTEESDPDCGKTIYLAEIHHKPGIKKSLKQRQAQRRNRRNRKTRYRKARFANRHPNKCACCGNNAKHDSRYCSKCHPRRDNGYRDRWLPPSLNARVDQTMSIINKLCKNMPIAAISTENVKFDTQLMQNPNIEGVEYQHGQLAGYEVKEYLLEKWGRQCVYCGKENVPLEVEHITPKSRGGSNRITNLTLACHKCNQKKGDMTAEEFGFPEVQKQAKQPLKDAAMMNATRWELYDRLKEVGLPVECGSGARTKMQRLRHGLPKEHYYDACCVGVSTPHNLKFKTAYVLEFHAKGRGTRQRTLADKNGFPRGYLSREKTFFGFQNGDYIRADVPKGKYQGEYTGYAAIRRTGYFDIRSAAGKSLAQGISYKYCHVIQRYDGYKYERRQRRIPLHPAEDGVSCANF